MRLVYQFSVRESLLQAGEARVVPADPIRAFVLRGISGGDLRPGQRLPTERELSARFATPRSAVRKTLTILEAEGAIVRHVGRGTFVSVRPGSRGLDPALSLGPDTSPAEVMEARLVLEPHLADLVVKNATSADFREMQECLRQGAAAAALEDFERWDRALHLAIARATHNALLVRALEVVNLARRNAEWGKLKRHTLTPERRVLYQAEHEAAVQALHERDADLARQRLLDHLLHVRRNLLGY